MISPEVAPADFRRMLQWGSFLTLVMLAILVIDLQLKRTIGRQVVLAQEMLTAAVVEGGNHGTTEPVDNSPGGGPDSDRDGADDMGGTPRVAARSDRAASSRTAKTPRRAVRKVDGAQGDGG